jgi:DUF1680 family protein
MYVTGGIGSSRHNEGFTEAYDLPNYDAYCETCASVGMVFWNSRMNHFTGDAKYIDVLERSMYNGVLAGISLAGDRFFYVNPLASKGEHHRQAWYGCACCPSQISRFIPSIGNYIYGTSSDAIWVNLYIGNTAEIKVGENNVALHLETYYPWDGDIKITVKSFDSPLKEKIKLRIPGWCKSFMVAFNGKYIKSPSIEKGYITLDKEWKPGDEITLSLKMLVDVVAADPHVKENTGKRAIQHGPLVYCIEETDNKTDFDKKTLRPNTPYILEFEPNLLNGILKITTFLDKDNITLIPYYTWDNREAGKMKVWIDYNE